MLWTIVWYRYNNLHNFEGGPVNSYARIAQHLRLKEGTVRQILMRFERNNFQIHMARKHNGRNPSKITEELARYLLAIGTLEKWAGYTLKMRVGIIRQEFGVDLHVSTLFYFYQRNGITLRLANYRYQHVKSPAWLQYRRNFVIRLAQLIAAGAPLCYMDEAAMNSWTKPASTYMPMGRRGPNVAITISGSRYSGITMFGCIGSCMPGGFIYQLSKSTTKESAQEFFREIRAKAALPKDRTIFVVMDNHGAHRTPQTRSLMAALHIEPVFMSSNSPEFNSIEALWGLVKKRFQSALNEFVKVHNLTSH